MPDFGYPIMTTLFPQRFFELYLEIQTKDRGSAFANCGFTDGSGDPTLYRTRKITETYKLLGVTTGTIVKTHTADSDYSETTCSYTDTTTGSTGGGFLDSSVTTYEDVIDPITDLYDPINAIVDALDPVTSLESILLGGDKGFNNLTPLTIPPSNARELAKFTQGASTIFCIKATFRLVVLKNRFPPHAFFKTVTRDPGGTLVTSTDNDVQMGEGVWESDWTDAVAGFQEKFSIENYYYIPPWLE